MAKKDKSKIALKDIKTLQYTVLIVLVVIFVILGSFAGYSISNSKKVYKNQYLAQENYAGKSKIQLFDSVSKLAATIEDNNFELVLESDPSKSYKIPAADVELSYDTVKMVNEIWLVGREKDNFQALIHQLNTLENKTNHAALYTLSDAKLQDKIRKIAAELDQPEKDLTISYSNGKFVLLDERKNGKRLDQEIVTSKVKAQIALFDNTPIKFDLVEYTPKITEESANSVLLQANKIVDAGEITLKLDDQAYTIDKDTIGGFIKPERDGVNLKLVLNEERVKKYIAALAQSIDSEPQSAKMTMVDGKINIFQPSHEGKILDQDSAIADIGAALFARITEGSLVDIKTVSLKAETKKPELSETDISTLGINELVGTAYTNFKGSTANRIHNITVGAAALNGVVLKPGEEFSTLSHLGTIDATGGYLEELVIKENRTTPEFGGGLCQVSSTLFRAALNAGMKITERQNHKYRVSYYEPPVGMDATIYDPAPDFKFVNNYASHILIQSKVEGTKITFEFYGTKDNRQVTISAPSVFDFVSPDAPTEVETDTLAPGVRKQIEKAHQGATATFSYKVVSATGESLQDRSFKSVYVPWPEKWLVGKAVATPTTTCSDSVQNGDETGVDCGGSCPTACPAN
ncbi:MAG: VanW family protein [Candidatus Berkelbacteria bacterium]